MRKPIPKFKFLKECSTESLKDVFNPERSSRINCMLGGHLLREIVYELAERKAINIDTVRHMMEISEECFSFCDCGRKVYAPEICSVCDNDE